MKKKFILSTLNNDLDKRWYIHYSEANERGRIVTIKKYGGINKGKTVEERIRLANLLIEVLEKTDVPNKTVRVVKINRIETSFCEALELIRPRLREKTYYTYKSKVKGFIDWCKKEKLSELHELTQRKIVTFLNLKLSEGRSNKTFNAYKCTLQRLTKEMENIRIDVFSPIKKLQNNSTPAAYFQDNHKIVLKKKINEVSPQLWQVCQCIYFTLIRPGELRLLKISDIDLENGTIIVRAAISKNKKTEPVAIPNEFLKVLLDMNILDYPSDFYLFGSKGVPSETACRKDYFQKKHLEILRTLKFDTTRYKLYSWKHSGAVAMVKSNIHIKFIQIQGRWHDLDQVNSYLRQLGTMDMSEVKNKHVM